MNEPDLLLARQTDGAAVELPPQYERGASVNRPDVFTAAALFLLASSVYFATASGITSSNDGSHYALLRALVDEGRFEISTYAHFAEGNDLARVGERIYSDRPPGTALLAAPFYVLGDFLPAPLTPLPSRHDAENPRVLYAMLLPVFAGAGVVALAFGLVRGFGLSGFSSVTASLAFAFGSLNWKYGSVLFSHAPSAFLVMLGIFLALRISGMRRGGTNAQPHWWRWPALGFTLGLAVLVEYSNLVYAAMALAYLLATAIRHSQFAIRNSPREAAIRHSFLRWVGLAAGLALPLAFLGYYNAVNFGGPFVASYAYAVNYPWAANLTTTFDYPLLDGLKAMLWYSDDPRFLGNVNQGLFLLTPVAWVGFLGLVPFWKTARRECLLIIGVFLVYLLLFSKHHTLHGYTRDGRYLAPFLGLWFAPLAFALEGYADGEGGGIRRAGFLFACYGLLFLSIRNQFVHIGYSYNYRLDLAQLAAMSTPPENWAYALAQVFPNAGNLPLLWLAELGLAGMLALGWRVARLRGLKTIDRMDLPPNCL